MAGSRPSAARMATPGPRPSSSNGRALSGWRWARRSNSAGWPRATSISIRVWRRPASGISRPATPSSPRPAAGSRTAKAARCGSAPGPRILSCRSSLPGAIPPRPVERAIPPKSLGQSLLDRRPALDRIAQQPRRIRGESIPVWLAAEQIEPLPRHQPEPRIAGHRDAAGEVDRVVTTELRAVNMGLGEQRGAVALVAEAPDRAGLGGLELLIAEHGLAIGKIGGGIAPGNELRHDKILGPGAE